jgi:hypothetical protein
MSERNMYNIDRSYFTGRLIFKFNTFLNNISKMAHA